MSWIGFIQTNNIDIYYLNIIIYIYYYIIIYIYVITTYIIAYFNIFK